jgi:excisionase family DNA binding protein
MARRDNAGRGEDAEWVSAAVAAERLCLGVDAVRTMIRRGALPGEKDARGHWRVRLPRLSAIAEEGPSAGTLSVEDAVAATGVAAGLLWSAVHERRLRVVRCGGELRFRTADLEAWIEAQRAPVRRRESRSVSVPADPGEDLLTIDQAAARLGVAPATLWRWLNGAELPFVLAPGRRGHRDVRHVRTADVDQLADRGDRSSVQE